MNVPIKAEVDINIIFAGGKTILIEAAGERYINCVQMLLKEGHPVHKVVYNGMNAFYIFS